MGVVKSKSTVDINNAYGELQIAAIPEKGQEYLTVRAYRRDNYPVLVQKQYLPSFPRMPESSVSLKFLDPGLRQDDVVSGKHVLLDGYYLILL